MKEEICKSELQIIEEDILASGELQEEDQDLDNLID